MTKYFFLVLCLLIQTASVVQAGQPCLTYEPNAVELKGKVKKVIFPGPPNYESVKNGDKPESYWVLFLPQAVCVQGSSEDKMNSETEKDVKEIQLMIKDYKKFRPLLEKDVSVTGKLMHSFTGHHHTPILLQVESMTKSTTRH